ncbi:MAG TPA: helix-turn-helix domain-containing protein [Chthoniobacteraceae bacterium]|nr:helix-turn-helix domain-containing protein [Chthoniobacteraceae bacterium]
MSIEKRKPPLDDEQLIDFEEAARLLGNISGRTVRRLIAAGELPKPVKVLSVPRLYRSDVSGYLQRLKDKRGRNR